MEVRDSCAGLLDGFAEYRKDANVFRGVADKVTDIAERYDGRMDTVDETKTLGNGVFGVSKQREMPYRGQLQFQSTANDDSANTPTLPL